MRSYPKFKKQLLQSKGVKKSYDALGPEFEVVALLIKKRFQKGLTQEKLARMVGTKQEAISRFESGTYNPSLGFLFKVADALDARIRVSVDVK